MIELEILSNEDIIGVYHYPFGSPHFGVFIVMAPNRYIGTLNCDYRLYNTNECVGLSKVYHFISWNNCYWAIRNYGVQCE
jgi:hypothetical protein